MEERENEKLWTQFNDSFRINSTWLVEDRLSLAKSSYILNTAHCADNIPVQTKPGNMSDISVWVL